MADALLAQDHFYINASQYNNTNSVTDAVIEVSDSTDILDRSDEWMVHITRFSCDSMASLPYIEADATARWEIKVFDDHFLALETFNFIMDRDFATPLDLVSSMNVKGRFRAPPGRTRVGGVDSTATYETYRFSIDAGGRFRLSQPDHGTYNRHITYSGTPTMNALLGFDSATQFLKFAPSHELKFANAVAWLHQQAINLSTPANIYSGRFYTAINRVLVHLLNGLEIRARTMLTTTEITGSNQPSTVTHGTGYLDDVNVLFGYVGMRGQTPTPAHNTNEALLIPTGTVVLCEYFDHPHATHHTPDTGFKVHTSKMSWYSGEEYDSGGGAGWSGIVEFQDLMPPYNQIHIPPSNYPTYLPGTAGAFAESRYIYPLDSIIGYYFSGLITHLEGTQGSGVTVAVQSFDAANPHEVTLLLPLRAKIEVGDDFWFQDKYPIHRGVHQPEGTLTTFGYSVHQVTAISEDRRTVTFDFPFGPRIQASTANPPFPHVDLLFTDRRVPFQSRSSSWLNLVEDTRETYIGPIPYTDVNTQSHILVSKQTNAQRDDVLYWIVDDVLQTQGFDVSNVFLQIVSGVQMYNVSYYGQLPGNILSNTATKSRTGFFIHKRAGDLVRWIKDAKNLTMAATTFSYEMRTYPRGALAPEVVVGDRTYPERYQQTFNRSALHYQVLNAAKVASHNILFDNVNSGSGSGYTFEQLSDELVQTVPDTAEIVDYGANVSVLDFGSHALSQVGSPIPDIPAVNLYGHGTVLTERLTHPFLTVRGYSHQPEIMAFVKNNPQDRPWLNFIPGTDSLGTALISFRAPAVATGTVYHPIAPLCIGIVSEWEDNEDAFLIWTSSKAIGTVLPIDADHAIANQVHGNNGLLTVAYNSLTRAYNIGRKEMNEGTAITAGNEVRLYSHDGDYIASTLSSQVDLIFPFRQIILTSADLQQVPERSQDAASRQPILSSYTLSTIIPTSINAQGEPAGGTSQAFGTIYFSETGARRFHHLIKVPGPLRQFKIEASITRKDPTKPENRVQLSPGGQFTCQLLFMRKRED